MSLRPVSSFRDLELNVYDTYQHQDSVGFDHKISQANINRFKNLNGKCIPDELEPVSQENKSETPIPQKSMRECKIKARHLIYKHFKLK